MRIAIGQLWQETNTFNPQPTTRSDFEAFGISRGDALVEVMAETNELGGFIQTLRTWPEAPEIVGLVRLPAWPSGRATAETGRWLVDEMVDSLRTRLPVDAVLLALHGSLAAEGMPDVEGELLESIRGLVGPSVPVVATLDLHANVTTRMVSHADALVTYHTAPHIDVFETGQRGAKVLRRILVDGATPTTTFVKIPMVLPAERANTQDPASISYQLRLRLEEWEKHSNVLACGLTTVQPWLDIPELGSSVLVVTDGEDTLANRAAHEVATEAWEHRRDYLPKLLDVADAVRQAHERDGFVVLSDGADATTSGAPGDSNWLLQELLRYPWDGPACVTFVDPELVERVRTVRTGEEVEFTLGGKRDHRFSQPLALRGKMVRTFEAKFVMSGHLAKNMAIDMGLSAIVRVGNVHIFVTSRSGPHFAPEFFAAGGLDVHKARLLVAKSPCGFRAVYEQSAKWIANVRAPGCAPADFWTYPYEQIERPLWPWDESMEWKP